MAGIHLHGMEYLSSLRRNRPGHCGKLWRQQGAAEQQRRASNRAAAGSIGKQVEAPASSTGWSITQFGGTIGATAWRQETSSATWVLCELDMQENYMRRMLCHAMDYVRRFCDLHQAFTSEKLVSFMWALAPDCRTDDIYWRVLKDLDPRLCSLPWARTGIAPDGTMETDSELRRDYHAVVELASQGSSTSP